MHLRRSETSHSVAIRLGNAAGGGASSKDAVLAALLLRAVPGRCGRRRVGAALGAQPDSEALGPLRLIGLRGVGLCKPARYGVRRHPMARSGFNPPLAVPCEFETRKFGRCRTVRGKNCAGARGFSSVRRVSCARASNLRRVQMGFGENRILEPRCRNLNQKSYHFRRVLR